MGLSGNFTTLSLQASKDQRQQSQAICLSGQGRAIPTLHGTLAKEIQDILVKKLKVNAYYNKFIRAPFTLHQIYCTMRKENFDNFEIKPLIASILPRAEKLASMPRENSKYGKVLSGSILFYQQKLFEDYVNDFSFNNFPELPLDSAETRFDNSVSTALTQKQQSSFNAD